MTEEEKNKKQSKDAPSVQRIYTDIESAIHPDEIDQEFKCPGCGRLVSNTTPRQAVFTCKPCGIVARIENYKVIRIRKLSNGNHKLKFQCDDLLGFLVWIEDIGGELPKEHAIAVKFFESHNPKAFDTLRRSGRQVHMGIIKLNLSGEKFIESAVEAATKQAKKLEPCAYVIQHGSMEIPGTSHKYRYVLCSFFQASKTAALIPQPFTSIELL